MSTEDLKRAKSLVQAAQLKSEVPVASPPPTVTPATQSSAAGLHAQEAPNVSVIDPSVPTTKRDSGSAAEADENDAQGEPGEVAEPGKPYDEEASDGAGHADGMAVDPMLEARYVAAIRAVALASWNASDVPDDVRCEVRFTQIPGGRVVAVEFLNCGFSSASRAEIQHALTSTLLPYVGFEGVFARHEVETVVFCQARNGCTR